MAEFKTLLAVGDMADKNVVTINETDSVKKSAAKMKSKKTGSLLVIGKSGKVSGIVTEQDIVRRGVASGKDLENTAIVKIMTKNPIVIDHSESIFEAKKIMAEKKIMHLIVIKDDKPVGIFTAGGVLKG